MKAKKISKLKEQIESPGYAGYRWGQMKEFAYSARNDYLISGDILDYMMLLRYEKKAEYYAKKINDKLF